MRSVTRGTILATLFVSLGLSSCSFFKNLFGGGGESAAFDGCPKTASEVSRLSWTTEEPHTHAIKTGLLSAVHLDRLTGGMSEELTEACGDLAKQLFVGEKELTPEEYKLGADAALACQKADEALRKLKEIAGGSVKVTAGVPLCSAPMNAARDCLNACQVVPEKKKDQKKMPPVPTPECEGELSGICSGNCNGTCTFENESDCAGTCAGLCQGACDSEFTGECRGKCEGTCNGEKSAGECDGTCQGKCEDGGRGTCGGTCTGECEGACTIQAAGKCEGVCSGECDKSLDDTRCTGTIRIPGNGEDACHAACDTLLLSEMKCIAPAVKVKVEGSENEEAKGLIERSLSQHLPKILAARALNVEQARVEQAVAKANEAMEALKRGADASTLEEKNKVCLGEAVTIEADSAAAIPTIFDAATVARSATAGD
jgi:hypothetical protein